MEGIRTSTLGRWRWRIFDIQFSGIFVIILYIEFEFRMNEY